LHSSRSGFDRTKSGSDFDERSVEEGNFRSHKSKRCLVLQERRLANGETFVVFEERCLDLEERGLADEETFVVFEE
jgi:hypothetical protein